MRNVELETLKQRVSFLEDAVGRIYAKYLNLPSPKSMEPDDIHCLQHSLFFLLNLVREPVVYTDYLQNKGNEPLLERIIGLQYGISEFYKDFTNTPRVHLFQ